MTRTRAACAPAAFAALGAAGLARIDPRGWRARLLTSLGTLLVGAAMLAAGGGAATATFSIFLVWVVVYAVVFLPRAAALAQVGLAALVQAGCLAAVGDGALAPAQVAVTLAVGLVTARCVACLLERARVVAGRDHLTGLLNRGGMVHVLDTELARARREGREVSVVVLDLDAFKAINDAYGHPAGDQALVAVARAWSGGLRAGDSLARVGGDEFVAVLADTGAGGADDAVRRLAGSTPEHLSVSIGTATGRAGADPAALLARADAAMYRQKRSRRRVPAPQPSAQPRPAAPARPPAQLHPDDGPGAPPPHDVCFCADDDALVRRLAAYVGTGLDAGEVCVLVATAEHCAALRRRLGPSLAVAEQTGRYLEFDATETLARLAPHGGLDAERFDQTVGNLLRGLCFDGRAVRAYGEMVGLLWNRGDVVGALALEDLWSGIHDRLRFRLLCGYPTDAADLGAGYAQICARHHHDVSRLS